MQNKPNFRNDIQALRGIAVLFVLLFHAFEKVFPLGFLGVDVFFVISGYVVSPLIFEIFDSSNPSSQIESLKVFLRNRFFRLAPALGFVLVITSIVIFITASVSDITRFARQGIYSMLLTGNIGAYKTAGNYFNSTVNPLTHTWSLAVEQQIYIFLPLIFLLIHLLIGYKFRKLYFVFISFLIIVSLYLYLSPAILSFVFLPLGITEPEWAAFYFPTSRLWEFLAGTLAWCLTEKVTTVRLPKEESPTLKGGLIWLPLIAILLFPVPIESRLLPIPVVLLTGLILYKADLNITPRIQLTLMWLGNRSYSIYLVHLPLLYIPKASPLFSGLDQFRQIGTFFAAFGALFLGHLIFTYIESPLRISRLGNSQSQNPHQSRMYKTIPLIVIPLIFLSLLSLGEKNRFFGLDKNLQQPAYAGFLDSNCLRDSRDGPPCRYNVLNAERTILLIGDSHAGHFSQAIVDAAREAGWNAIIYVHSSCRFELFQDVPKWCTDKNNEILEFITSESPELVLLSQSIWPGINVESAINSIKSLEAVSNKLVILNQTPVFKDSRFMNPGTLFQKPYDPPKYMYVDLLQEPYMKLANEIYNVSNYEHTTVLDLNHNYCDGLKCYRFISKGYLYRDLNHLSPLGASLSIKDFISLLAHSK